MLFILWYLVPLTIVGSVCVYMQYREGLRNLTYGELAVMLGMTFTPLINLVAVLAAIIAGLSYIWEEYQDKPVFK